VSYAVLIETLCLRQSKKFAQAREGSRVYQSGSQHIPENFYFYSAISSRQYQY
jgi:hypothetical protein